MKTRIVISLVIALFSSNAFSQMGSGYGGGGPQGPPPSSKMEPSGSTTTTTKTKTGPSMSVKEYLDAQIAGSKDKRFHLAFNGKDLGLIPVKFHEEKKTSSSKSSTAVDMKGADGKLYEVVFLSSGGQPVGAKIHPLAATH